MQHWSSKKINYKNQDEGDTSFTSTKLKTINMNQSIFKPILFGVLFGAALFFAPFFLLKVIFFIALISFLCRVFFWRRGSWNHYRHYNLAFADKLRGMSDAQYAEFKNRFNDDCCGHGCHDYRSEKSATKTDNAEQSEEKK